MVCVYSSFYGRRLRARGVRIAPMPDESEDDLADDSDADEDFTSGGNVQCVDETSDDSDIDSTDDDDDQVAATSGGTRHGIKWTKTKWTVPELSDFQDETLKLAANVDQQLNAASSPYEFFNVLFDSELVGHLLPDPALQHLAQSE